MLALLIIGIAALVFVVLRGGPPPEPRIVQVTLDPIPPAPPIGGWVLLALWIVLVLALFGGR